MSDTGGIGLEEWLEALASEASTPGGGAAAAIALASAAALVSMVCRLTIGRKGHEAHEATMQSVLAEADTARGTAVKLMIEDERAFGKVIAAYKLPRGTDVEKAARQAAIGQSLLGAAEAPMRIGQLAARVICLGEMIREGANPNLISDVDVALIMGRAAVESAIANVEINLNALRDDDQQARFRGELREAFAALKTARKAIGNIEERI
jgi:formiminotetrahydrofolate cyclodeaminase